MAKKKVERYFTSEDVKMRLDSSIVLYKGQPFYAVATGMELRLYALGKDNKEHEHRVSANSADLDIRSVELGYLNQDRGTCFIYRVPYRKQKQGMGAENLEMSSLLNPKWTSGVGGDTLLSEDFRNMMMNVYPSIQDCFKMRNNSGAFAKNFAIRREFDKETHKCKPDGKIELICNQRHIGYYNPDENGVTLDEYNNHSVMTLKLIGLGVKVLN